MKQEKKFNTDIAEISDKDRSTSEIYETITNRVKSLYNEHDIQITDKQANEGARNLINLYKIILDEKIEMARNKNTYIQTNPQKEP